MISWYQGELGEEGEKAAEDLSVISGLSLWRRRHTLSFYHLSPSVFVLGNLMRSSPRRQLWAGSRDGISVQRKGWLRPAGALLCQCYVCTCVYVTVSVYVWVCMCDSICVSNLSVECILGNQNLVAVGLTCGMWQRWGPEFGPPREVFEDCWARKSMDSESWMRSLPSCEQLHNLGEDAVRVRGQL